MRDMFAEMQRVSSHPRRLYVLPYKRGGKRIFNIDSQKLPVRNQATDLIPTAHVTCHEDSVQRKGNNKGPPNMISPTMYRNEHLGHLETIAMHL